LQKILIADDHPIVRKGIRQILLEVPNRFMIDEACNGQEVLDKTYKNNYDVILLDISMPGISGLDVLKKLKQEKPKIPVIILSVYSEEQYAVRAMKTGASAYLTKESAPEELLNAIRKVSLGGKYVTTSIAEKLASAIGIDIEKPPHESLSNREYQILCMIGSGKSVKKIADELHLSGKTVSTYRSRILRKMRMKNNAELTRYAIKNNLV